MTLRLASVTLLLATGLLGLTADSAEAPPFGADGGPEGDAVAADFGLPEVLREDDPTTDSSLMGSPTELLPERYLIRSVPWRAPDYRGQNESLGWESGVFKIPPELEKRVAFWRSIYTKYSTDQGVLHDLEDLTRVYESIDFAPAVKQNQVIMRLKMRERNRLLNEKRKQILSRLERLAKMRSEKDLRDADDRRYLALFTKDTPAVLFQPTQKKNLEALRAVIRSASAKRRVRFQLGQRDKFILGVYYSGRYLRAMENVFRKEKLPIELTRLPFVESSFNIQARSRVGASGVWQFMPRTAKPTMMVNRDVDERNDPLTATAAAARLLRSNFEQLGSWPLALTAYNHGAAGVQRAVRKAGSRDLAVIIDRYESRRFGFASSNFYACFLAALEVEQKAKAVFGDVKWSLEFDGREVDLKKPIAWRTVVDLYDGEAALAELQNPHLLRRVKEKGRTIPRGTFIRVPSARHEVAHEYALGQLSDETLRQKLAVTPIVPMRSGAVADQSRGDGGLSMAIGTISEAAMSLLPFLAPEQPAAPDGKVPTAPDDGPALPSSESR